MPFSHRRAPPRSTRSQGFGIRQNDAVHVKDDWIKNERVSSSGLRDDPLRLPSSLAAELVSPPSELGGLPSQAEVEKRELTWCLRHQRQGSYFSRASCRSDPGTTSKIRDPRTTKPRLDGRMVTRERCLSPIEPEASSETGSFRRRAPVAASSSVESSRERLEIGRRSGHAFFRVAAGFG